MDIKDLRKELDSINKEMTSLLVKRLEISKEVAIYKKEKGLKVKDEKRENEILEEVKALAGKEYEKEAEELFLLIFSQSCKLQEEILK